MQEINHKLLNHSGVDAATYSTCNIATVFLRFMHFLISACTMNVVMFHDTEYSYNTERTAVLLQ